MQSVREGSFVTSIALYGVVVVNFKLLSSGVQDGLAPVNLSPILAPKHTLIYQYSFS